MLTVHRAERADALVGALGELLRHPTGDPFEPEIVAVPSRGVERWLAQRLSHVLGARDDDGVCANVVFPSSTRLLDDAVAEADDGYAEAVQRWSPDRSVWPLMEVIDRSATTQGWAGVLAAHLGLDASGGAGNGRRFAVAGKLARLFDRYDRSRPAMVRAWADGRNEQGSGEDLPPDLAWQAELWRRLREDIGVPAPAELLDTACARIAGGAEFSIFGATRISPARVHILGAVARTRNVHLWLHHPSPALWSAVIAADERPGRRRDQRPVVGHPLLASMSRDVRELQQLLHTVEHGDTHHPMHHADETLLGRLQGELAHDVVPAGRRPIAAADDSVQVHAAHGRARQVEVVREVLLGLFSRDSTLEPRDVLIMCPDVEAFAPLVAASFGMADEPGGHPAAQLRVRLADRSLRQTNPLLSLLAQLLELATSRVTATQLLDLAGAAPVRRRFGFDDDAVERLRTWTVSAGARWGLDAHHRGAYGLSGLTQGTWRSALDRLLLGVAMQEDRAWIGATVPLDDVDSGDIDLVGRFAELLDRVDAAVRELEGSRTVAQWAMLLGELVEGLGDGDEPWQMLQLRRELDEVAESAGDTDVELGLADVSALLNSRLAGRPTRANFRTGTLTVCTLVPMRSVPHRVVCLLGMDDGAFPRQAIADGDDILARDARTGERDPRSEDRQLFLDAVCAAQRHLIVTFTGADPRSGADVPPCVPLAELLDAIDATALAPGGGPARAHVVVHHPLQPFDRRNFIAGELGTPGPFSFDPAGLAGARAAAQVRTPVPPLLPIPLAPVAGVPTVSLEDLVRFLQHPARGFLRQRLGVSTITGAEDPDDALTVELDGLDDWEIGERVLSAALSGVEQDVVARLEGMRGNLPPGPLGQRAWRRIGTRVDALLQACAAERRTDSSSIDITVLLDDGRALAGTVAGVHEATILTVSYSTLAAKHRLAAWVRYLAVVATTGDVDYRAVTVGRRGEGAARSGLHGIPPASARRLLAELVALRDAGLCEPLPLPLETAAEYATRRWRGASSDNAVAGARQKWEADRFRPERDEPEHLLIYCGAAPLERLMQAPADAGQFPDESSRFGALARLLWTPLLTAEGGTQR